MVSSLASQRVPMGQMLINSGALTEEQLAEALEEQKLSKKHLLLGEMLVELGYCTEEQVMESLAAGYDLPFARISPKVVDPRIIDVLPREFL